ncbi:MAG TPA: protein translocase subunit SecD, partial [Opitutaceae bacterium]
MFKRNLWKIILSLAVTGWAVAELFPLKDIPFPVYAKEKATVRKAEFSALLDQADARFKSGAATSDYMALKQIGKESKIDMTQFFPDVQLEDKLSLNKRNDILLKYLLDSSKKAIKLGLDLQGGVGVTLEADLGGKTGLDADRERQEKLSKAIEIIDARINGLGVTEPLVRAIGANRIEIQLPGISTKDNPDIIKDIGKPAKLEFRKVYDERTAGGEVPPGYELMAVDPEGLIGNGGSQEQLYIKRIPEMTGHMIANAYVQVDPYGKYKILMQFTSEGTKRFGEVTRAISDGGHRVGRMAIVLDGMLVEAPTVHDEIDGNCEISGSFTQREALNLANILNNPLDVPLSVKNQYEVGPSLAADAISSGFKASLIGLTAVAAFMITFYSTGGVVAVLIGLAVNLAIILGVMANIGATMTLPGLAGIVLTIGMAVDANILIFERMREELTAGKSLATANQTGYMKALMTIVDAHIVQLLICAVMIWLGSGPIRGFGVTLAIGVLSTMFSVLITVHLVMELLIDSGTVKKITMRRLIPPIHLDFVKYGLPAFSAGWLIALLGLGFAIFQGGRVYGIDFSGGDVVTVQYKEHMDEAKIRQMAASQGVSDVNINYQSSLGGGGEVLKIETPEGKSEALLAGLQKAYPEAGLDKVGEEHVGSIIGKEIQLNALKAVGVSMLIILLYIAFRFEFGFGVGAMVSTLHDISMTIGV